MLLHSCTWQSHAQVMHVLVLYLYSTLEEEQQYSSSKAEEGGKLLSFSLFLPAIMLAQILSYLASRILPN